MTLDAILEANRRYARAFALAGLEAPPRARLAILTCMDARLEPLAMLGLRPGDGHVMRNAGGRARDAERSLALSCAYFGTRRILVVHHTECGTQNLDDASVADRLRAAGARAVPEGSRFLGFADLEESVRDDVSLLRASPLIPPDVAVDGLIYDVRSALLRPVDRDPGRTPPSASGRAP